MKLSEDGTYLSRTIDGLMANPEIRGLVTGLLSETKQADPNIQSQTDLIASAIPVMGKDPPTRGTRELLEAYKTRPWLRAIVGKIAFAVATTEWHVFAARNGNTGKFFRNKSLQRASFPSRSAAIAKGTRNGELEEIVDHPLIDALSASNDFITGLSIRQLIPTMIDIVGEAPLVKQRNAAGMPTALFPVPSYWIKSLPVPDAPWYDVQFPSGKRVIVLEEDMIFIKDPSPSNPYRRGTGIAAALGDELDTDEAAAKLLKYYLFNKAHLDKIIYTDGKRIAPSDVRRVESLFKEKIGGFFKAFSPIFVTQKLGVIELSAKLHELGLAELREQERDIIMQVYGMPPELMGVLQNSNRATIDSAEFLFAKHIVLPRLEMMRAALQWQLVPDFDDRLILHYDSPIQEDREHALKVMKEFPYAFNNNDKRVLADHEPWEGEAGELVEAKLMQRFVTPEQLAQPSAPPPPPVPALPAPEPAEGDEGNEGKALGLDRDPFTPPPQLPPPLNGNRTGLLTAHKQLTAAELDALLETTITEEAMVSQMASVISATVERFGNILMTEGGALANFSLVDPEVVNFLRFDSADRIERLVNPTTQGALRRTLAAGIKEGESISELQDRIGSVFSDARGARSHVIARSETARAAGFGANEGIKQSGTPFKSWLVTSPDDDNRDTHKSGGDLDGQTVKNDEHFTSESLATAQYPGDFGVAAEDIQCRCSVIGALSDEKALDSEGRLGVWKARDAERLPFESALQTQVNAGFRSQEAAMKAALVAAGG